MVVIATNNKDKYSEFKGILNQRNVKTVSLSDLDVDFDVEETEDTIEGNSVLKAREYHKVMGRPVIAEDSGIEVLSLDRKPGVYSKRYADNSRLTVNEKVLTELGAMGKFRPEERKAEIVTCISYKDKNGEVSFTGKVKGIISDEERGSNGFGYDTIFIPDGETRTLAEMTFEEKNKYSPRKKALESLLNYFQ